MNYSFGQRGVGEHRHFSFLIRPQHGSPLVRGLVILNQNGIEILTPAQAVARGNVPCDGLIQRFCTVTVRLDASSVGAKTASFQLRVADAANPNAEQVVGPFEVQGSVISAPTVPLDRISTVSIRTKASQAGLSVNDYLRREFTRIMPTSFVHNATESDALTFDLYLNPWDPVDWRNNWSNSVFDFSGSSWDSYGPAPTFHGSDSPGGVAITRCHIATADHYPRGGGFMFHTRTGTPQWFTLTGATKTPNYDIRIYRIEPCLPPDAAIYALPSASDNLTTADLSQIPYLNNHYNKIDFIRRISVTAISSVGTFIWGAQNPQIPSFMQVSAQLGDSGSPSFIYVDGQLVVLSTFTWGGYGGGGPFYGDPAVQQEITAAIQSLP